jgi:hypothetical protein
MTPSLRAATAMRVYQRQSTRVQCCGLGGRAHRDAEVVVAEVAGRTCELKLGGLVPGLLGGVEELGTEDVGTGSVTPRCLVRGGDPDLWSARR